MNFFFEFVVGWIETFSNDFFFFFQDPAVRGRMSMRRDTLHKMVGRRSTVLHEMRRRSSVAFQDNNKRRSSMAIAGTQEEDSD